MPWVCSKCLRTSEVFCSWIILSFLIGGFLTRETVPANNSCLFTSINYVLEDRRTPDLTCAPVFRELIASVVRSDQEKYTSGFLGRSNEDYCAWILDENSWGGGIELAILSDYFKIEITVVDTQNVRLNHFGEDQNHKHRCLLIYDGIHYDPLVMEASDGSGARKTRFDRSDESVLTLALELAAEAKASRQFTDVNSFTIRCLVCQKCFKGQTEAQEHAKQTKHINFGEV